MQQIKREQDGGKSKLRYRILLYAAGLMCMAFGVAFSVKSGLGVSPVSSLPYVISLISGIEMGSCVMGVFTLYVAVQIIIYRKDFRWINLTQIIFSILFGYFVDFAEMATASIAVSTYMSRLLLLILSLGVVALGVSLYMEAGLVNMPMEGMTAAITDRIVKKRPFHEVKVMVDCFSVALALVLSLVFLERVEGVREGTLITAVCVGNVMKPIKKRIKPLLKPNLL